MSLLNEMLSLLTGAYDNRPDSNTGKLLGLLSGSLDGLSSALYDVTNCRDLQQASGSTLNRLGINYGVARGGLDDATYRLVIAIKMMARISAGDGDTVLRSAAALLGVDDSAVTMTEGTGSVTLLVDELDVPPAFFGRTELVTSLLTDIVAAGISLTLELQRPVYYTMYMGLIYQEHDNITIRQVN